MIYLARPNITNADIKEAKKVLKSGMLVQGKVVRELEEQINKYIGSTYCSCVSNGTASLHLALVALGIGPGDEVIVPSLSFVATANVVEIVGATCVFVDVHPRYFNIDESQIEKVITKKTKAIIPVHEFGLSANMTKIVEIAKKYNLFIIEDAACALGATYENKYAGTFGDFGSFSLHPRKAITSGEGGLLVTSSFEYDKIVKTIRNHGIEPNSNPMNFTMAGFNYRLTEIQAALVKSQLSRIDSIIETKANIAFRYLSEIKNSSYLLPLIPKNAKHTWQTFHILIDNGKARERLIEYLKKHGIFTNYGAQCIPAMNYYQNKYKSDYINDYSSSYNAYTCGLAIPLYETLTTNQVNKIISVLNKF